MYAIGVVRVLGVIVCVHVMSSLCVLRLGLVLLRLCCGFCRLARFTGQGLGALEGLHVDVRNLLTAGGL